MDAIHWMDNFTLPPIALCLHDGDGGGGAGDGPRGGILNKYKLFK